MAAAIALERAGLDPACSNARRSSARSAPASASRERDEGWAARRGGARAPHGRAIDASESRAWRTGADLHPAARRAGGALRRRVRVPAPRRSARTLVREVPEERVRLSSKLVGFDETPDGVTANFEDGIRGMATCSSARTGCAPPSARCSSASRRPASRASRRGAASSRGEDAAGFGAQIVVWPGRGRHCMTYPVRDGPLRAQRVRPRDGDPPGGVGAVGDLATCAAPSRTRGRRARTSSTASPRRSSRRSTSATRCPCGARTASSCSATPRTRRRRARGRARPWRSRTRSCSRAAWVATRCRPRWRLRGAAPAADVADARDRAVEPRDVQRARPDADRARNGRLQRDAAARPLGERCRLALRRTTRGRGRRARGAAPPEEAPDAAPRGAARGRPVARRDRLEDRAGSGAASARATSASSPRSTPPGSTAERHLGHRRVRVAPPGADEDVVVLHLHGGGYTMGSARGAAAWRRGWRRRPAAGRSCPTTAWRPSTRSRPRWRTSSPPIGSVAASRVHLVTGEAPAAASRGPRRRLRDARGRLPEAIDVVSPFCDSRCPARARRAAPVPTRG